MTLRPLVSTVFIFFYLSAQSSTSIPLESKKDPQENLTQQQLNEMDLAQPINDINDKKSSFKHKSRKIAFYDYHQSGSFAGGFSQRDGSSSGLLGVEYQLPSTKAKSWVVGADVINNGEGFLSVGYKYTLFPISLFRPHFKTLLGLNSDGQQGLAELVQLENFRIQLGFGAEYLLLPPFSLRSEIQYSQGKEASELQARLGLSWGWY